MKKLLTIIISIVLVLSFSLNAFAFDFTPSAEKKEAPENVGIKGEDGETHDGVFYDDQDEEVGYVDPDDTLELVITSGSKRESAPVDEIKVMINEAEFEIEQAKDVGKLAPSMKDELKKLKEGSTDAAIKALEIEDFVVSNLFDISLLLNDKEIKQIPDGQTLKFRLQTNFKPTDVVYVLVNCDGLGWVLVDAMEIDDNGIMTITASKLCCMAFVVPGFGSEDPDGPHSPQDGYADWSWLLIAGVACLAAAACIACKKQTGEN